MLLKQLLNMKKLCFSRGQAIPEGGGTPKNIFLTGLPENDLTDF